MDITLDLTVQQRTGLLAQVSVLLVSHGFTLRSQQYARARSPDQSLLRLVVSGRRNIEISKLCEELRALDAVKQAEVFQLDLDDDTRRLTLAYPALVGGVHEFEQSIEKEIRQPTLLQLGKNVGTRVCRKNFSNFAATSISEAMQKLIAPAVHPFLIANTERTELHVLVCPFCRDQRSTEARCSFLTGFVWGLFDAVSSLPKVRITEINCKAKGDNSCTFVAIEEGAPLSS